MQLNEVATTPLRAPTPTSRDSATRAPNRNLPPRERPFRADFLQEIKKTAISKIVVFFIEGALNSRELFFEVHLRLFKSRVDARGILTASLRHVGTTAAAPLNE